VFWPTWTFVGTLAFGGGTQGFAMPTGGLPATHILIEASSFCAPKLIAASAWVVGGFGAVPMWFAGQRSFGTVIQALLRIDGGVPVFLEEIDLVFRSVFFGTRCAISVFVVL
jgi:hypothetical protein